MALLCGAISFAQAHSQATAVGTVTGTGLVGSTISYPGYLAVPATYSVAWSNDGTAATACSYRVQGSVDGTHFYDLTGTQSCTTNGSLVLPASGSTGDMLHIANKPVQYLHVYVTAFTAGDVTTAVKFQFVRGVN